MGVFSGQLGGTFVLLSTLLVVLLSFFSMHDVELSADLQIQVNGCNDTTNRGLSANNENNIVLQNVRLTSKSDIVVLTHKGGRKCTRSKKRDCNGRVRHTYDPDHVDLFFKTAFFDYIYPEYIAGQEYRLASGNRTLNYQTSAIQNDLQGALRICHQIDQNSRYASDFAVEADGRVASITKDGTPETYPGPATWKILDRAAHKLSSYDDKVENQAHDFGGCSVSCKYIIESVIRGMRTQVPRGNDAYFFRNMVWVYPMLGLITLILLLLYIHYASESAEKESKEMPILFWAFLLVVLLIMLILLIVHQGLLDSYITEMDDTNSREGLAIPITLTLALVVSIVFVSLTSYDGVSKLKEGIMANFL